MSQSNSYKSNSYGSSSTSNGSNGTNKGNLKHGGSNRQHGSSNRQHGSSNNQETRAPSCPHCTNLNKFSKTDTILPTNHYLRETPSPDSKLVCPVLLATECRYCKEFGHTVSKCPLAAAENKRRDSELARHAAADATAKADALLKPKVKKAVNRFSALDSDSDNESTKRSTKSVKSPYSTRTTIPATSSTATNKRKRDEPVFDFPEMPTVSVVASGLIVADLVDKPILNFMNAIKTQPAIVKTTYGSCLPPMLVEVKPPVKMGIFNMTKPSWAESESDDEDTESDRQRLVDEHEAWMDAKILKDILKEESVEEESVEEESVVEESIDSW